MKNLTWPSTLLHLLSLQGGCVAAVGDYVLAGGWKQRGRIFVNRMSDGAAVGQSDPGPAIGGAENAGQINILPDIIAYRRADDEYLQPATHGFSIGRTVSVRPCD